ncbi:MAG: tetratricopeptide repeat protein [Steroidobacteraceae bacterium]|jgi:predicted negative regulator of RcsB-dependent stress response|nr:tetratricopeptide repeat protein [Steroidobacteraceae bacterium]
MVDEYLDEREQAEQIKNWFKENWLWLVAGVGLGLGGLFGFRAWDGHLDRKSQEAAAQFGQMLETLDSQGREAGLALVDPLVEKYGRTPYADQARLVAARVHVEAGELDAAAARLRQVMDGSKDPELALVARLRLARVESAAGRHDAALGLLAQAETPAIAGRVNELRGDILFAKGDRAGALAAYQKARDSAGTGEQADGLVDLETLALKIGELSTPAPAPAAAE